MFFSWVPLTFFHSLAIVNHQYFMVNINLSIQHRCKALEILRSFPNPVSANILAGELGISRVALWKMVRKLRELAYPIHTGREGYQLAADQDPDLLCPWELGAFGLRTEWFPETSSTMEEAKNRFSRRSQSLQRKEPTAPAQEPFYTVAETQTAGRGRFHRSWESLRGGIYLTVTLFRRVPLAIVGRYPLLAGVVWVETLQELFPTFSKGPTPHPITLKWPNDILMGNRKIGGILLDMEVEGDTATRIDLGIGFNVRNHPKDPKAAALIDLIGPSLPPRRMILQAYLHRLERALVDPYLKSAIPRWKRFSSTLGKPVRILFPASRAAGLSTLTGTAVDIGPGGELVVRSSDGSLKVVSYGDCHHRR